MSSNIHPQLGSRKKLKARRLWNRPASCQEPGPKNAKQRQRGRSGRRNEMIIPRYLWHLSLATSPVSGSAGRLIHAPAQLARTLLSGP